MSSPLAASVLMPHGPWYLWVPAVLWLHVASDALLALAYYSIPIALLLFVKKRRDLPFAWMFVLFGVFIVASGATHLMAIVTIWQPYYWWDGGIKAVAAAAAAGTAVVLWRLMAKALSIPSVKTLADSEESFRLLIDSTKEYAIYMIDSAGIVVSWNAGAERVKGYKASEIIGKSFSLFYGSEAIEAGLPAQELAIAVEKGFVEGEAWHFRKDGSRFWAHVLISTMRDTDGRVRGFAKVTQDLTERKVAEETRDRLISERAERTEQLSSANSALHVTVSELKDSREQLRQLSKRFHSLPEKERARIAHEVHDQVGQMLAVMKIELVRMKSRARQVPEIVEQAQVLMDTVDQTVVMLRRISSDLRPVVLEQLGLGAALEWLVADISRRTGIHCTLELAEDLTVANHEVATGLFRIVQEAITNALKHSGTDRIHVGVKRQQQAMIVSVRDYGCGIAAKDQARSTSLGLIGMRERALAIGGSIMVQPDPTAGTVVLVEVPFV